MDDNNDNDVVKSDNKKCFIIFILQFCIAFVSIASQFIFARTGLRDTSPVLVIGLSIILPLIILIMNISNYHLMKKIIITMAEEKMDEVNQ